MNARVRCDLTMQSASQRGSQRLTRRSQPARAVRGCSTRPTRPKLEPREAPGAKRCPPNAVPWRCAARSHLPGRANAGAVVRMRSWRSPHTPAAVLSIPGCTSARTTFRNVPGAGRRRGSDSSRPAARSRIRGQIPRSPNHRGRIRCTGNRAHVADFRAAPVYDVRERRILESISSAGRWRSTL